MKKILIGFILLLLQLTVYSSALANICICQYPKQDARFGTGVKGEIGFYKMGCALWQIFERGCRKRKVFDINKDMTPFLDKKLRPNEKIKLSYVGHWGSSNEFIEYLDYTVKPLLDRYQSSVEVENTACLAMEDAASVQKHIDTYDLTDNVNLKVNGNQTTSIGMWDKLWPGYGKADLYAISDSDKRSPLYPSCNKFINKRCTGFQVLERGFCSDGQFIRELICNNRVKIKRKKNQNSSRKVIRKAKVWQYY